MKVGPTIEYCLLAVILLQPTKFCEACEEEQWNALLHIYAQIDYIEAALMQSLTGHNRL